MSINILGGIANQNIAWPPLASGRFYSAPNITTLTTLVISANVLYAIPFFVSEAVAAVSINLELTAQSAGNNVRLGIYNDNNGAPGSLLVDGGAVSTTGTGNKSVTISTNLPAGWYWLACVFNGTPTVRALSQTSALGMLGFTSGTDTTTHVGWSVAFTYAALPDPFTAGGALTSTAMPRILLGI